MNPLNLSRAAFMAAIVGASLTLAAPAEARRDTAAEQYVQANASAALQTLAAANVTPEQREQNFATLMARFSNVPEIAGRVLGPYGRQVYADPQLRDAWLAAFRAYMFATYEYRLDRYRGNSIRVVDSNEIVPGQRVEVLTEVAPHGQSRPLPVRWRLNRSGDGWKVIDVSLILDGGEIWLADQQRQEFLAFLDRHNRDVSQLISNVQGLTATMRARTMAGN